MNGYRDIVLSQYLYTYIDIYIRTISQGKHFNSGNVHNLVYLTRHIHKHYGCMKIVHYLPTPVSALFQE